MKRGQLLRTAGRAPLLAPLPDCACGWRTDGTRAPAAPVENGTMAAGQHVVVVATAASAGVPASAALYKYASILPA